MCINPVPPTPGAPPDGAQGPHAELCCPQPHAVLTAPPLRRATSAARSLQTPCSTAGGNLQDSEMGRGSVNRRHSRNANQIGEVLAKCDSGPAHTARGTRWAQDKSSVRYDALQIQTRKQCVPHPMWTWPEAIFSGSFNAQEPEIANRRGFAFRSDDGRHVILRIQDGLGVHRCWAESRVTEHSVLKDPYVDCFCFWGSTDS